MPITAGLLGCHVALGFRQSGVQCAYPCPQTEKLAQCEVCGNEYAKAFSGRDAYSPTLIVALTR